MLGIWSPDSEHGEAEYVSSSIGKPNLPMFEASGVRISHEINL